MPLNPTSDNYWGQYWVDTKSCDKLWEEMNSEEEFEAEKTKVFSIGCHPKPSIDKWMEDLRLDDTAPAPIEWKKHTPIIELLKYKGVKQYLKERNIDVDEVGAAIWRAYDEYCDYKRSAGARCDVGCPKKVFFTHEDGYVQLSLKAPF